MPKIVRKHVHKILEWKNIVIYKFKIKTRA